MTKISDENLKLVKDFGAQLISDLENGEKFDKSILWKIKRSLGDSIKKISDKYKCE